MAWFKGKKKYKKKKRKKGDCSWGNKREFWECFFAMETQLSLINLSRTEQVPDYNTLERGGSPGGSSPCLCYLLPAGSTAGVKGCSPFPKSHHVWLAPTEWELPLLSLVVWPRSSLGTAVVGIQPRGATAFCFQPRVALGGRKFFPSFPR